ncbi:MAG: S-methyl-5-thioribose-1-phosphate isomerase [Planctomycetes bacterium]|nr:S-methyl-5-thioribose-1-phosphate isomerase [Planctomycetota bacterium]MBU1518002.1 S-methyl-5-thioribose-1-phosphate isomerase [Planctomycetota bacterium]MBU2457821.1 S-methyl-5-thioribose-1-phosphate isomerase [Planctomycetota bacterium]
MIVKNFTTLQWKGGIDGCLELTDQRKLPAQFITIQCKTPDELFDAIKTLAVRGAPAIGVAEGFGVCLAARQIKSSKLSDAVKLIEEKADYLSKSRPTAVNLFWALERMKKTACGFAVKNPNAAIDDLKQRLLAEAQKIYDEDVQMCHNIGINGEKFVPAGGAVLTHCNAGALATAGDGTALAPVFEAQRKGKKFKVYVDETRPVLQGARLTAWELHQAGIDVTLICDNMAGVLMKEGKVNAVFVGADRIAANGDAANKIGTYSLSILAKEHKIPFYVAAPSSTFDLKLKDGSQIPIEQREPHEVLNFMNIKTAPEGVKVYNPAFDVTPAKNITAIITEKGIVQCPTEEKIKKTLNS